MAKKLSKLPGVLSFQRCLLVTDGLFYNELDGERLSPLWVIRHGIRGTQNINKASKEGQAASASAKREEVSNIQTTDSAKLADELAQFKKVRESNDVSQITPMPRPCWCASTCAAWMWRRRCSRARRDRRIP